MRSAHEKHDVWNGAQYPLKWAIYCWRENIVLFLESTSYVWATAFGRDVGDSKKPLTLSARYLSSWLAFLSLIFVNVYVARLMAEIVKQEPTKPFTSLQDPEVNIMYKSALLVPTCNNLVDIIRLVARLFQQVRYSHNIKILLQPCVVNLVTFLLYHDCIRLVRTTL
jgi:hypothetical protein